MSDRAERYAARLDEKLPTFRGDAARKEFLLKQREIWERLYNNFVALVDNPEYEPGDKSVYDYANTLAEIDVRLAKYEGARR